MEPTPVLAIAVVLSHVNNPSGLSITQLSGGNTGDSNPSEMGADTVAIIENTWRTVSFAVNLIW